MNTLELSSGTSADARFAAHAQMNGGLIDRDRPRRSRAASHLLALALGVTGCTGELAATGEASSDGFTGATADAGPGEPRLEAAHKTLHASSQTLEEGAVSTPDGPRPPSDAVPTPGGEGSPSSQIRVSLNASRISGVAPLSIVFDGIGTTHRATTRPFHDLRYEWHFGDADAGSWSHSDMPRNTATGPVAGHVFERPGTYRVQLTVRDADGLWAHRETTVEVQDPDVVFAGNRTICFSARGNFAGCPAGATRRTTSSFDTVAAEIDDGRRLLLRRGDVFQSQTSTFVESQGPGTIGAFGSGAAPVVRRSRQGSILILSKGRRQMSDWRLMDLEFQGVPHSYIASGGGRVHRFLALRLRANDFRQFIAATVGIVASQDLPMHSEISVVDCDFRRNGHVGLFLAGERMLILGNRIVDSQDEHIIRTHNLTRSVIAHNYLAGAPRGRELLKLAGMCTVMSNARGCNGEREAPYARTPIRNFVVQHNVLVGGENYWDVVVGPQSRDYDERLQDGIVERNRFVAGGSTQVGLNVFASRITVRNNLFELRSSSRGVSVNQRGIEPRPAENEIYENQCAGGHNCVDVSSVAVDTFVGENDVQN